MAVTAFGSLSSAQKRVWANEVTIAGRDQNFWMSNGFVGRNTADMTRPVHRITELTQTERGLTCIMQLVAELQNDGVVGDNMLEGNEEALVNDSQEINVDQLRHGVRSKGRVSEQATVIRFRNVARDKLSFWLADTIDELMFLTAAGRSYTLKTDGSTRSNSQLPSLSFAADVDAASSNRIVYAGSATSEASLTSSDKMSWDLILRACAYAKRKRIKPIRANGRPYYAIVMSTEQMRDLKQDNTYQTLVAKAGPRGANNPLFNNAAAVVDGVILYEHQKVYNTLGAAASSKWGSGGNVDGAQAVMMGAQALGLAMIGNAEWEESDNTDYKNRPGIAYGRMVGLLKPQFKSVYDSMNREDFGLIHLKTAAAETQT
jgi:N4-gp56 family major capsid protein